MFATVLKGFSSRVNSAAAQRASALVGPRALKSPTLSRSFADISGYNSQVCAVLGAQWGDEGKGKLVDILADRFDIIGRFNGGANAGHTLVVEGKKYAFHLIPCGILREKINLIGNGVVLHVPTLLKELENLKKAGVDPRGRLKISNRAHLLFDFHQTIDQIMEDSKATQIGTTRKGIGPCYTAKISRTGVRVADLVDDWADFERKYRAQLETAKRQFGVSHDPTSELATLKAFAAQLVEENMVVDGIEFVNRALREGKTILAEGANAALLDVDYGTYPYVTSSSTCGGGIATGLGLPTSKINSVIGVVKAYTTRVGGGPFPTELLDDVGEKLRKDGVEFGTTTGRPRRCGWLDLPILHYSHALNGYSSINITKLDVLSPHKEIKIGVAYEIDGKELPRAVIPATLSQLSKVKVRYETLPGWNSDISKITNFEDLPKAAKEYLRRIEDLTGIPVSWIGVGAGREAMLPKGFQRK